MNEEQLLENIIRPVLKDLKMHSSAAEILMLGTAIIESDLHYIKQIKGPALGIYQVEPGTHKDNFVNYLNFRGRDFVKRRIDKFSVVYTGIHPPHEQLVWNLAYATAQARLVYWRRPDPLPEKNDAEGLASYHKQHYNTYKGKTEVLKSIKVFDRLIEKF